MIPLPPRLITMTPLLLISTSQKDPKSAIGIPNVIHLHDVIDCRWAKKEVVGDNAGITVSFLSLVLRSYRSNQTFSFSDIKYLSPESFGASTSIDHFQDHPLASLIVPDDDDCLFMHTQPPFRWVTDDEQVMSILLDEDMDSMMHHRHEYHKHNHQSAAPLTRSKRHDLKKTNIPERLVYHYESQIIAYLDEQDQDLVMVLDIADGFSRWVVHIMCSYYNLVSFSKCCARVLLLSSSCSHVKM